MFNLTRKALSEGSSLYVALEQRVQLPQKGTIYRHLSPWELKVTGNGPRQMYRLGLQKIRYFSIITTPAIMMAGVYRLIWVYCEKLEEERNWACAV